MLGKALRDDLCQRCRVQGHGGTRFDGVPRHKKDHFASFRPQSRNPRNPVSVTFGRPRVAVRGMQEGQFDTVRLPVCAMHLSAVRAVWAGTDRRRNTDDTAIRFRLDHPRVLRYRKTGNNPAHRMTGLRMQSDVIDVPSNKRSAPCSTKTTIISKQSYGKMAMN
jgi:hypothetical protein